MVVHHNGRGRIETRRTEEIEPRAERIGQRLDGPHSIDGKAREIVGKVVRESNRHDRQDEARYPGGLHDQPPCRGSPGIGCCETQGHECQPHGVGKNDGGSSGKFQGVEAEPANPEKGLREPIERRGSKGKKNEGGFSGVLDPGMQQAMTRKPEAKAQPPIIGIPLKRAELACHAEIDGQRFRLAHPFRLTE